MLETFNELIMRLYYYLIEKQQGFLKKLVLAVLFFGVIGFTMALLDEPKKSVNFVSVVEVITDTLGLFVSEWNDDENWALGIAKFLGITFLLFSVLILLFEKYFEKEHIRFAQKRPYDLIIGLSEQNVSLLKNEYKKESVIIIEKDRNHKYLNFFQRQGFPLIFGHTKETLKKLDYTHMGHCIISTNNDRKNIALGKFLLNKKEAIKGKTLHICIENRDLNVLFKQDVITNDIKNSINIITYSLYENMAKKLFLEHSILGNQPEIIKTNKAFNIILVGDSDLAIELVYHITFLSTLPNENQLTLYLVGIDALKFKNRIKKIFPKIEKISHLILKAIELDSETLDFYENNIWKNDNLTNIFIATKNEEKNLDITINLQDTTYIREIGHQKFKTKVLFALYHNLGLAEEIDKNQKAFANFYSFGNIKTVSTKEILINEEFDKIAKLIHNDYKEEKDILTNVLNREWLITSQHKQDSNKTQALHLDIKLLAFELQRVKSTKDWHELLRLNRKKFYSKLENSTHIKDRINAFNPSHFPSSFKQTIDKVAKAEHNRWCAFHHLNGWVYSELRKDDAKEHDCLQPFEKFTTDETKETYKYDLASVYFIPDYLARGGFEIIEKSL